MEISSNQTVGSKYFAPMVKVPGAQRMGNMWVVPKGTPKPMDGRTKAAKQQKNTQTEDI